MSIENHKWSDSLHVKDFAISSLGNPSFVIKANFGSLSQVTFNKDDSLAIAKHFNQDRESLVSSIKELIVEYKKGLNHIHHSPGAFAVTDLTIKLLQKLIEGE